MPTTTVPSLAEQVRTWVDARPEGTPFRLDDLPVPADVAKVTLSRLAATPDSSGVQRMLRGVFFKGRRVQALQDDPAADRPWVWSFVPDNDYKLVSWYLGEQRRGLGYGGMHALHQVGWTDQVPVNMELVVVGKPPPSPRPGIITIRSRWNERRLRLSGAEVSIIEAARFSWFLNDDDLAPYIERFSRRNTGVVIGGLVRTLPVQEYLIRPGALRWAVETEQCKHADEVRARVEWFADTLPGDLRHPQLKERAPSA